MMAEQVAVPTRFFDRALLAAAAQRCDQVVLLACGMDARAFRLAWPPGTKVFELDFADVLAFKATVLGDRGATAACHRVEVAADLLLDRITAVSAPGSVLALDHAEDSELFRAARADISAELVGLWRGGPAEDLNAWLVRRGWHPVVRDIAEVAASCERPIPPAFDPARADAGRGWLATANLPGPR